ncbi:MAG: hypothetical protein R6U26_02630 [Candidatus Undinarchaeales archaeon]
MAEGKPRSQGIINEIENLIKATEAEKKDIDTIVSKTSKELSIHHRDLYSVMHDAAKSIKDEISEFKGLEKDLEKGKNVEKAAERYIKAFEDIKKVDESFAISYLTMIAILRYSAHYYSLRKKFDKFFNELGKTLESQLDENKAKKIEEIIEENNEVTEDIDELVEAVVKATHRKTPKGELLLAGKSLAEILEIEDVDSWVEKNFLAKRTSGKKVSKEIKE